MRVVDLHCHYPMHVLAGDAQAGKEADTVAVMTQRGGDSLTEAFQRAVLHIACAVDNYQGPRGTPSVTAQTLLDSPIRVVLSVLYDAFDEIRFDGAPPQPQYFDDLIRQTQIIEADVLALDQPVTIAKSPAQLRSAIDADKLVLIHAVEGGFHLGPEPENAANIAKLADVGVAYITVAHLFYRAVATNAPAIPFLSDWVYHALFHQPKQGLSTLGRTLVSAMVEHGILVDLTHMSRAAVSATLALLDELDPEKKVPVLATHSAADSVAPAEYNLSDEHIHRIAERRGVIGLIACEHWMAKGMKAPQTIEQTASVMIQHIERINDLAKDIPGRQPYESIGIGSDQDGFIKPAMAGLEMPGGYHNVIAGLQQRYDDVIVERICWSNALDVLNRGWKGSPSAGPRRPET